MAQDKAPQARADDRPQPQLTLHSQFLQDLSFENPQGARGLAPADVKPTIQVNLNVDTRRMGETLWEVAVKITANATREDTTCFLAEIDYRGVFSLTGVDETVAPGIVMVEGPRMLFPFARRIVADAVRDGGFPPLMLEPVDFVALYRNRSVKELDTTAPAPEAGTPLH